jgi:phosphoribosylamine--glycine ligase
MNILLIGSGGREHALAWKIAQSPLSEKLYCAPGNGGTEDLGENIDLEIGDHDAVIRFCRQGGIDLVVIGPEQPLVDGLADSLEATGIRVFGPSAKAARLEGSKGFTKDLCKKYAIPTADYGRFSNPGDAKNFASTLGLLVVIKADGLAAGKGVIIAKTQAEADEAIDDMFTGRFGDAGTEIVVEEFLEGEEASYFALTDGKNILPLATAQDHKRVGDGDTGPNTGGMGAYSPAPVMTDEMNQRVLHEIIEPTVLGMRAEGCPYVGVLYAGLMITCEGPKLIEYNCRFGDPECQVLMVRLRADLVSIMTAVADGAMAEIEIGWCPESAMTVVLAAKGYPGSYQKGSVIDGLDAAAVSDGVEIFHAGTARQDDRVLATGGRVLNVTALGSSVSDARRRAYAAIDLIEWPEGFCRSDIGWRAIEREQAN